MTTYTTFPATLFQRLVTFNTEADFKSRSVNIFFTFKPTTFWNSVTEAGVKTH